MNKLLKQVLASCVRAVVLVVLYTFLDEFSEHQWRAAHPEGPHVCRQVWFARICTIKGAEEKVYVCAPTCGWVKP